MPSIGLLASLLHTTTTTGLSNGLSFELDQNASTHGVLAARASHLSSSGTVVSIPPNQARAIQIVALVMASISVSAAMIAMYWFCLMRRNYRRDLVLLLILSDLLKNFCYVLFNAVNFAHGPVRDGDNLCQATGYLLQTGLEACDCAIFFISLHMFLQIFPKPNTIFGYDGLYNVRYWVYGLWFCLPNISACLAFINNSNAYGVQGTFCWLPVRPFWYRLALAWIPRYLIATLILGFAIAIYVHVGSQFNLFGKEHGRSPSADLTSRSSSDPRSTNVDSSQHTASSALIQPVNSSFMRGGIPFNDANVDPFARNMFVSPAVGTALPESRRHSLPSWVSPFAAANELESGYKRRSHSETPSRRGSKQVTFEGDPLTMSPLEESDPLSTQPTELGHDSSSNNFSGAMSMDGSNPPLQPLTEVNTATPVERGAEAAMKARNNAIRRQVRGLFAYPVAYIVFWIMPFAFHCMNYSDQYAAHPLFPVAFLSSFCVTTLGLVDVIIFCWRERPWRHIAMSDGTFTGSFCFWKFKTVTTKQRTLSVSSAIAATEARAAKKSKGGVVLGFFTNLVPWRRMSSSAGAYQSGASDRKVRENEGAQERLQMERRELEEKAAAAAAQTPPDRSPGERPSRPKADPGVKNWFDKDVNEDPAEGVEQP